MRSSSNRFASAVLSDACEALIAALYLDAGLERTRDIWLRLWDEELAVPVSLRSHNTKSALQEWAAAQGKPVPAYVVLEREGPDHAPVFTVEVRIEGLAPAQAQGPSRQAAEKAAALAMLERGEQA